MIELSPLLLLALGELLLISIVVSLGLAIAGFLRKSRERQAIAKLIARIKEDEARRKSETRTLMQEHYGFAGQQLESIVNKISREEKRLYQALINLFLKRDVNLMEVLHVECEGVTEPYRTLEFPTADTGGEDDLQSDIFTEMATLKEENERLTTELGVTMNTMGTMLKEYASMYAGAGKELDESKLIESLSASENNSRQNEPATSEPDNSSTADPIEEQLTTLDDMVIEKDEVVATAQEQDDSGLFDDMADIDIGKMLGDETIVIDSMEDLSVLNDETQVVNVDDDELVELEDEDLNLDSNSVDNGQLLTDSDDEKKRTG